MSSYEKDLKNLIKRAGEQGWRIDETNKSHYQLKAPDGETIVSASRNEGSWRTMDNILARMRAAGYVEEAKTSLGEVMASAGVQHVPSPDSQPDEKPPKQQSVPDILFELLSIKPMGFSDLDAIVRARKPGIGKSATSVGLAYLRNTGRIATISRGQYRLARPEDHNGSQPTQEPPVLSHTGDPSVDKDLQVLDEALAALAKLDDLIRRKRTELHDIAEQKAKLKKLLE